jgi:hypothetical protein
MVNESRRWTRRDARLRRVLRKTRAHADSTPKQEIVMHRWDRCSLKLCAPVLSGLLTVASISRHAPRGLVLTALLPLPNN